MTVLTSITFFERFEADILTGSKSITIRDVAEKDFAIGSQVKAFTFEHHKYFGDLLIHSITEIDYKDLSEEHAKQENMTLPELKQVIREIYPEIKQLYVIVFTYIEDA